jgi:hypothetical protein
MLHSLNISNTKLMEKSNWLTNNILPITLTLVTWAVSFGILTTKVDIVIKNQEKVEAMWLQLEKRVGQLEISDAEQIVQLRQIEKGLNK